MIEGIENWIENNSEELLSGLNSDTINRNVLRKIEIFKYTVLDINLMLEEILNTEVKVRIMKFLSKFPDLQFQPVEVASRLGFSISRTSECMKDLASIGILGSRKIGKGYLFKINKSNYLTRIILDVFIKEQELATIIAKDFVSKVEQLGRIKSVVLFGSALKELKLGSDIDLLIVSEDKIESDTLSKISAELTEKYGFMVSPILMTTKELKRKRKEDFIINVAATSKAILGKNLEDLLW